ncbi:MAG TPA: pyridoxal-phosphate dependent enzyme [Gemmatimonadaceae bacterium]|nr:pyridoxal-phosphate dependent enzyme [Gemmatimonadaceae bacterium]
MRAPTLDEIRAARERIADLAVRTPLVRLPDAGGPEVWLKLENLQPIGAFKLRGAGNRMRRLGRDALAAGVCTASAGNMAQGVAWCARELGVSCRVIVPDHAPAAKTAAVEALGAVVIRVPFEAWWNVLVTHDPGDVPGAFVHPFEDVDVMAGNGTIGIEILEDLPGVEVVIVPYGGGGLSCGIAAALRPLRPSCRILGAEVETAAPLRASLEAGEPRAVAYRASFVDGIGGRGLLPAMWPLVRQLLDGAIVVSLPQVADAVRRLATRARVVAEGAGAASLAAALTGGAGRGPVVCVISGGNIDAGVLARILAGETPA